MDKKMMDQPGTKSHSPPAASAPLERVNVASVTEVLPWPWQDAGKTLLASGKALAFSGFCDLREGGDLRKGRDWAFDQEWKWVCTRWKRE